MSYRDLGANESRVATDARQAYEAYRDAARQSAGYRGGMRFKTVSGRDYLVRTTGHEGNTRSLGPRSPDTEKILEEWTRGKAQAEETLAARRKAVEEFAGMSRAIGLGRVPALVAAAMRRLDEAGLLGKNLLVIGTHAMYAYEAAAGVMFDPGLMATNDIDLLWDARSSLKLALSDGDVAESGVMAILRKADRSFEPMRGQTFRAVNKDGFIVDLIRQTPNPPWAKNVKEKIAPGDLTPTWIESVKWLLASEKFSAVVFGQDGMPAPLVAPDPRAFATFKLWLSEQPDREPAKRKRDHLQAVATAQLVMDRFPHLPFSEDAEKMFPKDLRAKPPVERFQL
jgi:hypothetical protein